MIKYTFTLISLLLNFLAIKSIKSQIMEKMRKVSSSLLVSALLPLTANSVILPPNDLNLLFAPGYMIPSSSYETYIQHFTRPPNDMKIINNFNEPNRADNSETIYDSVQRYKDELNKNKSSKTSRIILTGDSIQMILTFLFFYFHSIETYNICIFIILYYFSLLFE